MKKCEILLPRSLPEIEPLTQVFKWPEDEKVDSEDEEKLKDCLSFTEEVPEPKTKDDIAYLNSGITYVGRKLSEISREEQLDSYLAMFLRFPKIVKDGSSKNNPSKVIRHFSVFIHNSINRFTKTFVKYISTKTLEDIYNISSDLYYGGYNIDAYNLRINLIRKDILKKMKKAERWY